MSGEKERIEKGISYIQERMKNCEDRLSVLTSDEHIGNMDEVWEAYYDLEEAILIANMAFDGFNRIGKLRKIPEITGLSEIVIRATFNKSLENIGKAREMLSKHQGKETIEYLRLARDPLKGLLLAVERKRKMRTPDKGN
jgi:hypothetical protein